jgi:hypothetical protein
MTNLADRTEDISDIYLKTSDVKTSTSSGLDEIFSLADGGDSAIRDPLILSSSNNAVRIIKKFEEPDGNEPAFGPSLVSGEGVNNMVAELNLSSRFSRNFPEVLVVLLLMIYIFFIALSVLLEVNVVPNLEKAELFESFAVSTFV